MKKYISLRNDAYPLIRLAVPLALSGLVQSAVWFFETLFLARLGTQTLAAGSLVSWFFGTLAVVLFGLLSSINILVAHKHGANDDDAIAFIAKEGIWLAILITIPVMVLLWNTAPIFLLFGQADSVVILAQSYLRPLVWGILANFIMLACQDVIMGLGHTRVILIFAMVTVSLEIMSSYIFIFGKFGFPALGIAGAGWAMTFSYWISAIIVFMFILLNPLYRRYFRFTFTFTKPRYIVELFKIGAPLGMMYCVEVAFFFVLILLMGVLGSQIQAANQVALQFLGLIMSVVFSIAQAVTIRMGHLLGAKKRDAAEKSAYIGVMIAAVFAGMIAIVYWCFPKTLISLDFDLHNPANAEIIYDIEKLLAVCAVFQIFEAIRIAYFGALRGLKDTGFTLLTSVIGFWCIGIPTGYLLVNYFKFEGTGFWWGMVMGAIISVLLLHFRFRAKI
jgi:MATE family multidrug resistance protein